MSKDKTARLWDRDGKPLTTLEGHTKWVESAVFSPDGSHILTASGDGTARLWDRDGKPLATLEGHTDQVRSAVFSPDGSRILTASDDKTARLWEAFPDAQQLIDRMKAEVPRCLTPEQRKRYYLPPATAALVLHHAEVALRRRDARDGGGAAHRAPVSPPGARAALRQCFCLRCQAGSPTPP